MGYIISTACQPTHHSVCCVCCFLSCVVLAYITAWATHRLGSDVNTVILRNAIGKLTSDRMVGWARDAIMKTGLVTDTVVLLSCLVSDSIAIPPVVQLVSSRLERLDVSSNIEPGFFSRCAQTNVDTELVRVYHTIISISRSTRESNGRTVLERGAPSLRVQSTEPSIEDRSLFSHWHAHRRSGSAYPLRARGYVQIPLRKEYVQQGMAFSR